MPPAKSYRSLVTAAALVLPLGTSAMASLVVYEPFDGYTVGDINGQAPNANTVGMNTAGSYLANTAYDFTTNGLLFSSLIVSGGALTVTTAGGVTGGGPISLSSPFTGTLYSSYLVNLTNNPSNTADTATMRINDSGTSGVGNSRFRSDAQSGSSESDLISAGYDDSIADGTGSLLASTTYLMLGRFTNVNTTLSAGTPGVATVYALSAAQFSFFKLDGVITDEELDGATVGTGADQVTGRASETVASGSRSFADGNAFQFAAQGSPSITIRYDEVRFGQSFEDVTPIPEPAIGSLLALSAVGLLARRRRS